MAKVHLRRLASHDAAQVLAWRNAPEVKAFMYSRHVIGRDEHDAWIARTLAASDRVYWLIELEGAGVGVANLARIDTANRRCEWAYYLADPSVRGRGVGTAVEYVVVRHVFEALRLNKLWCEVLVDNAAVWNLHERFGFTREAYFRAHVIQEDQACDVLGLGLLASDWSGVKAGAEARLLEKGYAPADLTLAP